jgi:thiol-disulfide isomerase/thioredoxin
MRTTIPLAFFYLIFWCTIPAQAVHLPHLNKSPDLWLNKKIEIDYHKPTLLFVFTRDCGNCHRSHAFINRMYQKYGHAVNFVGIHSPEFAWEKDPAKLSAYLSRNQIQYPVYLDSNMVIWSILENRYWPAFHLFDRAGKPVKIFIGETHMTDANAVQIEQVLAQVSQ